MRDIIKYARDPLGQAFSWLIQFLNNIRVPPNSNSQETTLPIALSNSRRGIHDSTSRPGLPMQIGTPLSQVYPWRCLINGSTVRRHNRSQVVLDHQATQQYVMINMTNPISHDSNHVSQSRELAKTVMVLVVPITELLLGDYKGLTLFRARFIVIVLSLGFTVTLNGMLLERSTFQRTASVMEKLGIALIYLGYFGLISSHLPPPLECVCWMCFSLSCVHLVLRRVPLPQILTRFNTNSQRCPPVFVTNDSTPVKACGFLNINFNMESLSMKHEAGSCYFFIPQYDPATERTYPASGLSNTNALCTLLIIEECCHLGLTVVETSQDFVPLL